MLGNVERVERGIDDADKMCIRDSSSSAAVSASRAPASSRASDIRAARNLTCLFSASMSAGGGAVEAAAALSLIHIW